MLIQPVHLYAHNPVANTWTPVTSDAGGILQISGNTGGGNTGGGGTAGVQAPVVVTGTLTNINDVLEVNAEGFNSLSVLYNGAGSGWDGILTVDIYTNPGANVAARDWHGISFYSQDDNGVVAQITRGNQALIHVDISGCLGARLRVGSRTAGFANFTIIATVAPLTPQAIQLVNGPGAAPHVILTDSNGHTALFTGSGGMTTSPQGDQGALAQLSSRELKISGPVVTTTDRFTNVGQLGQNIYLEGGSLDRWALSVKGVGGAPTSWSVVLEGTLDNQNFTVLLTHATADLDGTMKFPAPGQSMPTHYNRVRCVELTLGGAGATAIDVHVLGKGYGAALAVRIDLKP